MYTYIIIIKPFKNHGVSNRGVPARRNGEEQVPEKVPEPLSLDTLRCHPKICHWNIIRIFHGNFTGYHGIIYGTLADLPTGVIKRCGPL